VPVFSSVFAYEGSFVLAAPPAEVWQEIARFDAFESWWGWLRELAVDGRPLTAGTVMTGVVAPPIPYRMHLRVELVQCVAPHSIDAVVAGDLVGDASMRFVPVPTGTRADVAWTVEMRQRAMRVASAVGSPVLRWGHDRVVEATVARFRAHLADPTRRSAGPPAQAPVTTEFRRSTSTRSTR
jgi:carbon monoxide dehydrogenase subunit G